VPKARSVIPAKRGKRTWRVRAEMRRAFPQRLYCRRALVESIISVAKRKLSARAPGRTLLTQVRQAVLLGLSFNLDRLKHRYFFLRMSTEPDYFVSCGSLEWIGAFVTSSNAIPRNWNSREP